MSLLAIHNHSKEAYWEVEEQLRASLHLITHIPDCFISLGTTYKTN